MARKDLVSHTWWIRLKGLAPLIAILGAFAWASLTIVSRRAQTYPADALVIRIGHWQLESQVPGTLQELSRRFAEHPYTKAKYGDRQVVVVQVAVPEATYGQWATCQMMGGTAPDLVEIGNGLAESLWLQYETRYFEPLTDLANSPNPYNDDVPELKGVPLRLTYPDAMRAGYREELQEYTKVPLSRFTLRLFYNKTLLKKLTGLDTPPLEYREFLKVCARIARTKTPDGKFYTPIAASPYHVGMWNGGLFDSMTFSCLEEADFNRDGTVGSDELYAAFRARRLDMHSSGLQAKFQMTAEMMPYYPIGFNGLTRDEGVMKFAQQKVVFISTGTWDVGSLIQVAENDFEVGIVRFPRPEPSDKVYGRLILGPLYDNPSPAFPFGVTRFSKHPEVAKDFLRFMASRDGNQYLNDQIGWLPAIKGVPLPKALAQFAPVNRGMYKNYDFTSLGGETNNRFNQLFTQFQSDPAYTYDKFAAEFEPFYREQGQIDWKNQQRDWRRGILNSERSLAIIRGAQLLKDAPPDDFRWTQYRSFTASRQVMPEVTRAQQERAVMGNLTREPAPYGFLPEARENIRKTLASRQSAATRPANPADRK